MELSQRDRALMDTAQRFRQISLSGLHPQFSKGEAWLLLTICQGDEEGIPVSELVKRVHMPPPAVSRLLKGLEQDGFIQRSSARQDRRSILVTVTQEGRAQVQQMMQGMHAFWEEVFDSMSAEEFDAMLSGWNHMMDKMEVLLREKIWSTPEEEVVL
jgi:DNA-binding MarR family transcriptional regulator